MLRPHNKKNTKTPNMPVAVPINIPNVQAIYTSLREEFTASLRTPQEHIATKPCATMQETESYHFHYYVETCSDEDEHDLFIDFLQKKGCKLDVKIKGYSILFNAVKELKPKLVHAIAKRCPTLIFEKNGEDRISPLYAAIEWWFKPPQIMKVHTNSIFSKDPVLSEKQITAFIDTHMEEFRAQRNTSIQNTLTYLIDNLEKAYKLGQTHHPLYYICADHPSEHISKMLQFYTPPHRITRDGQTPLIVACKYDKSDAVACILDYYTTHPDHAEDYIAQDDKGRSALFYACIHKSTNITKKLLEHGHVTMRPDNNGLIPLHYALKTHRLEQCHILAENTPASVHYIDVDGRNILHHAVSYGFLAGVSWLLEEYPDILQNTLSDLFILCLEKERTEVFSYLVMRCDHAYDTLSRIPTLTDHLPFVWKIIDPTMFDEHGKNFLFYMLTYNPHNISVLSREKLIDIDTPLTRDITIRKFIYTVTEPHIFTWFHHSLKKNKTSPDAHELIQHGIDNNNPAFITWVIKNILHNTIRKKDSLSAFSLIIHSPYKDIIEDLTQKHPLSFFSWLCKNTEERVLYFQHCLKTSSALGFFLLQACTESSTSHHAHAAYFLLQHIYTSEVLSTEEKNTFFHTCMEYICKHTTGILEDVIAYDTKKEFGIALLRHAIDSHDTISIQIIAQHYTHSVLNTPIDDNNVTLFLRYLENKECACVETLDILIQSGADILYKDALHKTALHYAVIGGNIEMCKKILQMAPSLSLYDMSAIIPYKELHKKSYYNALHYAIEYTHNDLALFLIDWDQSHPSAHNTTPLIDTLDRYDRSPAVMAANYNNMDLCLRLIRDKNAENLGFERTSVLDYAAYFGDIAVAEYIMSTHHRHSAIERKIGTNSYFTHFAVMGQSNDFLRHAYTRWGTMYPRLFSTSSIIDYITPLAYLAQNVPEEDTSEPQRSTIHSSP